MITVLTIPPIWNEALQEFLHKEFQIRDCATIIWRGGGPKTRGGGGGALS